MPTKYAGGDQERAALDAYIKLWRASHLVEMQANRHLARFDLTTSQFGVLEAVYHLGPLSQQALAKKILRSSGNLTMVIDNLEKTQLVRRERNQQDRRVMIVSLTPAGRELIAQVLPPHVRGVVGVFDSLSKDELAQLSSLTRKLGLALSAGKAQTGAAGKSPKAKQEKQASKMEVKALEVLTAL
ncbi:MarR family transcriptional regulator [Deinococcus psychrotolerans]|uniref:MarR family transcriptional regulator n=1 Tax=Deinococcus psychrotolerans TaxID=2489213 RepID=A0A3G8YM08_9DEIO|nr:MarR family transcriptional regulator [Deinococcus psychrotolerans]AZI43624.1 MarR family transcriptional regulator [Deinococcus psychrotolerans]